MYPYSIHHTPEKKKPFFADFTWLIQAVDSLLPRCRCSPRRIRDPSIAPSQAPLVGGVVTHLGASHGFYPHEFMDSANDFQYQIWLPGIQETSAFDGKSLERAMLLLQNSQWWRFSKKYRRRDLTSPNPGDPKVPVMPISSKNTLPKIPKKNDDDVFICLPDRKHPLRNFAEKVRLQRASAHQSGGGQSEAQAGPGFWRHRKFLVPLERTAGDRKTP